MIENQKDCMRQNNINSTFHFLPFHSCSMLSHCVAWCNHLRCARTFHSWNSDGIVSSRCWFYLYLLLQRVGSCSLLQDVHPLCAVVINDWESRKIYDMDFDLLHLPVHSCNKSSHSSLVCLNLLNLKKWNMRLGMVRKNVKKKRKRRRRVCVSLSTSVEALLVKLWWELSWNWLHFTMRAK